MHIKCVFRFSQQHFSETFFNRRRTEQNMIKNVHWSSRTVLFILVRFLLNLKVLDSVSENTQISNFMKIRLVEAESFHADRRTDGRQT